jgi:hypothetical protein
MPLLQHQNKPHADLLAVHASERYSLDASDTGTGKTYVALQLVKDLGCRPLIICPKAVISSWKRVARDLGVEPLGVFNPEKLKTGKTPWLKKSGKKFFVWNIPDKDTTMILFDEVHQFGAPDSQNSMILAAARSSGCRVHCMSATLAETPLRLRGPGYLFGLHEWHNFYDWAARHGCYRNPWNGFEFSKGPKGQEALRKIHASLFPKFGVRVSIADLPDFPTALIQPESYDLDERDEVEDIYNEMEYAIADQHANPLVALLRARQHVELLKCPLVFGLIKEQLEENHSVVVFVNFKETLRTLKRRCEEEGILVSEIHGDQTALQRDENIEEFQENRRHVCLAIVQAGGVGISLHDLKGRPRVSFIFPPLTARDLKQALGRIHRAGALSPAVQKIVFAADTVEEQICLMVRRKLANLELLNDGDLTGGIL